MFIKKIIPGTTRIYLVYRSVLFGMCTVLLALARSKFFAASAHFFCSLQKSGIFSKLEIIFIHLKYTLYADI